MAIATDSSSTWIKREPAALSEWCGSEGFELSPVAGAARDWDRMEQELRLLWFYADDWDGHGSPTPDPELLASASEFLAMVREWGGPAPSRILPAKGGGVLIEWHRRNEYMEAEIEVPSVANWMRRRSDSSYEHWHTAWDRPLTRREFLGSSMPTSRLATIESHAA